jgi:hypothetical protein
MELTPAFVSISGMSDGRHRRGPHTIDAAMRGLALSGRYHRGILNGMSPILR